MTKKTRLITITALHTLSFLGGLFGKTLDAEVGFIVGVLVSYALLSAALIGTGKVKFPHKR